MIPSPFAYVRADSLDAAVAVLAQHGDEAKLLAGGHSLLPLMKLRLATPSVLVDVGRLDALTGIRLVDGDVVVGAGTRHAELVRSPVLAEHLPLLAAAAAHVGDRQVRHRGTLGGSLAHGDPASDLPAVALACAATFVVQGPDGVRHIAADDFFVGFLDTALAPDEVLCEVRFPSHAGVGWSFQKFVRRAQDWAIVGCAVVAGDDAHGVRRGGVGLVNMDSRPVRAAATERALRDGAAWATAAEVAADEAAPPADLHATVEFRRHLARVLVRRALEECAARV